MKNELTKTMEKALVKLGSIRRGYCFIGAAKSPGEITESTGDALIKRGLSEHAGSREYGVSLSGTSASIEFRGTYRITDAGREWLKSHLK